MREKHLISDRFTLDFHNGSIIDCNGKMIGITAYQERFLKYLIQNENMPCIQKNIDAFVYRGETVPKNTPNFYAELVQICPDLRERISVHKVKLMDIGYQLNISKQLQVLSDEMQSSGITNDELEETVQSLLAEHMDELQKVLTPAHQTVLKILLNNHDHLVTYQNIIQQSYNFTTENNPPLKTVQEIIGVCNDFIDTIPGFDVILEPVYVHTVGYMYTKHPDDPTEETESEKKPEMLTVPKTPALRTPNGYPAKSQLDKSYIYIGENTYLNLSHQIALQYIDDLNSEMINLTPQMVLFLDTLIKKSPLAVSKATLCWAIYDAYDEILAENLYEVKKKLLRKIPTLSKCIKTKHRFGYSIEFPSDTGVSEK